MKLITKVVNLFTPTTQEAIEAKLQALDLKKVKIEAKRLELSKRAQELYGKGH